MTAKSAGPSGSKMVPSSRQEKAPNSVKAVAAQGGRRAAPPCLQEGLDALLPSWVLPNANLLEHEVQVDPAALATVRPKHGVRAQDVHL